MDARSDERSLHSGEAGRDGSRHIAEITLRGLLLGAVITVVFMTANLYMGLKTGVTFSTSIPAAMLSMGLLRLFGGSGILENNIVQTQGSAAGTLCNVILVLPGLVLIGHWHGFPFWQTTAVCLIGGLIGLVYSIPLRRALVMGAGLPYPEGTAAAEVLHAGEAGDRGGLRILLGAAGAGGLIGLATTGFRLLADGLHTTLAAGPALFRFATGFSPALVGVGYLVGLGACLALLAGVALAWGIAVPLLTAFGDGAGTGGAEAAARAVWSEKVRLIGAGIIAVGAIWTVASLGRSILDSIRSAFGAARGGGHALRQLPRQERDLPITWVAGASLLLALPLAWLFFHFSVGAELGGLRFALVAFATLFTVGFGFLMAAACGYLAGLLGSSSSPISGIGILTTLLAALLLPLLLGRAAGPEGERFVVAAVLLLSAIVVTTASIANDNLQDLKTGQLVDATPWRQQVALAAGVGVGALVIAPLLDLLYNAYGFVGALPREGMDEASALPAPQAALMSQIAGGIVRGELPWSMVATGAGLGALLVALEARLRRGGRSFPALTVGIGMYLPLEVVVTIAFGGLVGRLAARRLREAGEAGRAGGRRRGVLLASGFLVGESVVGVLLAAADTLSGRSASLAFAADALGGVGPWLGLVVFLLVLSAFYRIASRTGEAGRRGNA
ncbi:MAG TPA: oligopeptide transporter, OPT family [Methylobacterium sp.]|uniref:OPT family oligopeptide transporter n=1 Tax=Methylorubrum sp. B1-46 TaxID=2897334 RepID=UPI001E620892|nr:oligopeptide transporter, OPT family [Methylorubrum sp. B1-46]UGB28299.1 oligopeptide transporter, OPT family [Methylorubrum sp. B1-46]HEV2545501.1 oligopeptide transporter, OPT family [Methylobacterium sp.]